MWYFNKIKDKLRKLTILDLSVMKVCLIAFTLMLAKLYPVVLCLEWGWYAVVFGLTYVYLINFFFFSKR
jgi:hypothetical protein